MTANIYFYEGECEKKLLDYLKAERQIKPGRLMKHNFWDEDISSKRRMITGNQLALVVFDTDVTQNHQRFIKNISVLSKDCRRVVLLAQHNNLEGELCFSCNIQNVRTLYSSFYSCRSGREFKGRFIREKNLGQKLHNCEFDHDKIWSRGGIYAQCLKDLCRPKIDLGQQYCRLKR